MIFTSTKILRVGDLSFEIKEELKWRLGQEHKHVVKITSCYFRDSWRLPCGLVEFEPRPELAWDGWLWQRKEGGGTTMNKGSRTALGPFSFQSRFWKCRCCPIRLHQERNVGNRAGLIASPARRELRGYKSFREL